MTPDPPSDIPSSSVPSPTAPSPTAPLAEKVAASLDLLDRALAPLDPARIAVAVTGGKDSAVALSLWRLALDRRAPGAPITALALDTGCKFPETLEMRDRLCALAGARLRVARPGPEADAVPLAQDKVACCRVRKVLPLLAAVRDLGLAALITGIRGDEHATRARRPAVEPVADPPHVRVHPLLHWTELDVWSFILERGLPYCSLYAQGYRSLGCMPCTRPAAGAAPDQERSGRDPDKEAHLDALRALGYF
ncbi:MAG: phosphoadenosine phosphosulfate reductase family protein [Desulfovibrionaceae bacterium]